MIDFDFLRKEILGNDYCYETPFGKRFITYADYTASGRSLKFIEKYLIKIQRGYANSHTEDDVTGKNMTLLLHEAEHLIKKSLNATENCYIIPSGTGATGAIAKFQEILGVYVPPATKGRIKTLISKYLNEASENKKIIDDMTNFIEKNKPVVFIGPYEHHSNELMWRESIGDVVEINLTEDGYIDIEDLEEKVSNPIYKNRYKIGSFSAASNVTGIISPVYDIARILHKYGAIACFDFAASAPYVEINMNKDRESYFDAVFISPHKFLGGPGSSGILIINKNIYNNKLSPTFAGGGTVDYVNSFTHLFSKNVEAREKPGTPGILQIIKSALCIDLKNKIGIDKIEKIEKKYVKEAFNKLSKNPNIKILGSNDPDKRVAIFSLIIKHKDKYLNPKLCTTLLNDLFGIQTRAGCSCAGPYGHKLLDITNEKAKRCKVTINRGYHCVKLGWLRVNFHYTMSEDEFNFLCDAIDFIATYGYLFIQDYVINLKNSTWTHKNSKNTNISTNNFGIEHIFNTKVDDCFSEKPYKKIDEFKKYLKEAQKIADELKSRHTDNFVKFEDKEIEELNLFYCKLFTE